MARKNKRWDDHQSVGVLATPNQHTCTPLPTREGHVCLSCGRSLGTVLNLGVTR